MNNIRTISNYTDYARDWRSTTTSASPYLEQLQPNSSRSSNVSRDIDPNRSTAFSNGFNIIKPLSPLNNSNTEKHEILVTDLPSYVDTETMKIILDRQGFKALHTKVDTLTIEGTIRFHGILEFRDEKTAREWIDYNEGYLKFSDGIVSKMEYMNDGNEPDIHSNRNFNNREREKSGSSSPIWTCAKCAMNNSNERHECFKCGTSIIETRDLEEKGDTLVGTVLCDTLLIRDLPRNVTETDIRSMLNQYTGYQIKKIEISRSKRYALVQMNDSIEAGYLLNVFNKIAPYINNDRVIVTFSKQSLNLLAIQEGMSIIRNKESYSTNSQARQKYASVSDQAYMQSARGRGDYEQHISGVEKSKTINTPFGVRKIFPQPNPKTFQLESSSGYYYNQDTGFYYDPSTEFYYDPQIQQWAFYCKRYSTYIPCEGGDEKLKKRLMDEEDEDDEVQVVENRYIPPKPARRIATPPRREENISMMRHGDVQIPMQSSWYDRMATPPRQAKRIPTPQISQLGRIPTQPDRYERVANSSRQETNLAYSWSERVASPPNEKRRSYEHRGASPPAKFLRRQKSPVRGKPRVSPETINQDAEEKIALAMDMIKTCNEQNRLLFQVLGNKLTDEDRRTIKNFESEISYICQAAEPLKEAQMVVKRTMEIWKKYDKVQDREEKREKINSWINPLPERRRESWNEREESSVMPKSKKASTWKENLPSRPRPPSRNPPVPRYEERRSDPDPCPREPFIDPLMQGPIRRELEWRSLSPPRNLDTWKPSAPIFNGPTQPLDDWRSRKSPGPRLRRWEDSRVEKATTHWQEKRPSSRDRPIIVAGHIPEFSRKGSSPKLLTKGILKREASRDESRDTWKSTHDLAGPSKIEPDWRTNSAAIHALQGNLLSQPQEKLIAQQSGNLLAQQLMALAQQQMGSAAAPFLIMPNPLLAQNFMTPSAGGLALQTPSALISGPKPVMSNSLQQYASNERDWQIALSQDQKKRAPIRIEDPVQSRPRRAATSVRAMPGTKATVKRERADMPREPARVQKESKELARIAKHEKSMINHFCFNCGVKGHRETVCKKTRAGRNHVMQKFEEYKKRIEAIIDRERTQYLAKIELTGQDLLSKALKKLAPHGPVTRNHLNLCEKCGEVGGHDDAKKCTNRRNPEYVDKMRLLINLYKCKHGIKDIDNEENIEDLELKDSLEDDYLTLTDSEPDTDIIVLDDDNNNEEKKSPKKDTKISRKQNIGKQKTPVAKTEFTKESARDESEFVFEHLVERKDETNEQETDDEDNIPWETKLEQITETNTPKPIQDVSNLVTEEILLYMKDILETVEDEIGN